MQKTPVVVVNPSPFNPLFSSFKKSIIEVSGTDADTFLHSQTTIDIKSLKNGEFRLSAVLDRGARIESWFLLAKIEKNHFVVYVDSTQKENLITRLNKYLVIEEVNFTDHGERKVFFSLAKAKSKSGFAGCLYGECAYLDIDEVREIDISEFIKMSNWPNVNDVGSMISKSTVFDLGLDLQKGCYLGQEAVLKIHSRKGNLVDQDYRKLKTFEEQAINLFENGVEFFHKSEGESALKYFREAFNFDSSNEEICESLGVLLGRMNKNEEAIQVMEKLIEINPNSIMARSNLSLFYMREGNIEKAEEYKAEATVMGFEQTGEISEAQKKQDEYNDLLRRKKIFESVIEIDQEDMHAQKELEKIKLELKSF